MEELIGKQLGAFQIVEPLGEGGMASVYKAYHPRMDRYVALKILPRHFSENPEFVSRFKLEARAIAKLEHPNILPVYDFGESDGYTYLAMRLVDGGDLSDLLREKRKLPLDETSRIISQVGGALDYAHGLGVVHRDIKPQNILIDKLGNCLLTDFGIAKLVEATTHLTHTGGILGTPSYVSPEQGTGKPIDNRTDIYSLGVVLFRMVVGKLPYKADTPMGVIFKHCYDPIPLPRESAPELPESVERVILKALAKDPGDRFSTAGEMLQALESAVNADFTQQQIPDVENASDLPPTAPEPPDEETNLSMESDVLSEPESVKVPKIEKKTPLHEQPDKVRKGHGWAYGILAIIILTVLAGGGWFLYTKIFISEPILRVTTNPTGADVYVDEGHVGISPIKVKALAPGTHKILVSKDRYDDYRENLFLQKDKPKKIQVKLIPKPFGDLSAVSNPSGAEVFIDGENRGITPVELANLPKGNRKVMLKKEGFDAWEGSVEIVPVKTVRLTADLISIYGGIEIASDPSGAIVYIDNKEYGKTPLILDKMEKGKHKIEIKKDGFDAWISDVEISALKVSKVEADLEANFGSLKVTSTPDGVEVYINGERKGSTPLEISKLKRGIAKVEARKKCYVTAVQTATISGGRETGVAFELENICGTLVIDSKPSGAKVKILNVDEPFRQGMALKLDRYHLEVSAEGYETKKTWLDLDTAGEKRIMIALKPIVASLYVNTDPEKANVKLLDSDTPFRQGINLKLGRYYLEVSAEGYETQKQWIKLDSGGDMRVSIRLKPITASLIVDTEPKEASEIQQQKRLAKETYDKVILALNPSDWESAKNLLYEKQILLTKHLDTELRQNALRFIEFFRDIDGGDRLSGAQPETLRNLESALSFYQRANNKSEEFPPDVDMSFLSQLRINQTGDRIAQMEKIRQETMAAKSAKAAPQQPSILIKEIEFSENTVIDTETLVKVTEPYTERELTMAGLSELVDLVTIIYQERGYILARAWLPKQDIIDGIVHINIMEAYVDEIEVTGVRTDKFTTNFLLKCFEPQIKHRVIKESLLEQGIKSSRMLQDVQTQVILKKGSKPHSVKLTLNTIYREKSFRGQVKPMEVYLEMEEEDYIQDMASNKEPVVFDTPDPGTLDRETALRWGVKQFKGKQYISALSYFERVYSGQIRSIKEGKQLAGLLTLPEKERPVIIFLIEYEKAMVKASNDSAVAIEGILEDIGVASGLWGGISEAKRNMIAKYIAE